MPNRYVQSILAKLSNEYGTLTKVGDGNSLYQIKSNNALVYFRYSKLTKKGRLYSTFYGLREPDMKMLQGKHSYICFVWDDERSPILIPYSHFESYFAMCEPSGDGQYKVQIYLKPTFTEFYIARVGKFNVDSYYGLNRLKEIELKGLKIPNLTHPQIQTLIGAIGLKKGFEIWCPMNDRNSLDYSAIKEENVLNKLPKFSKSVDHIISEVDVIWLKGNELSSLFEVEHSTPVYSGLLRFNDILIELGRVDDFNIVADIDRENKYIREIHRPTFEKNNLSRLVTFMDYGKVYNWYYDLHGKEYKPNERL